MRTQQEVLLPGPPSNLTARPTSAFSILVTWDPPSQHMEDVLKYKLYHRHGVSCRASSEGFLKVPEDFTITEKAFSWLKAPTSAFTFKTLLRHYAKQR